MRPLPASNLASELKSGAPLIGDTSGWLACPAVHVKKKSRHPRHPR